MEMYPVEHQKENYWNQFTDQLTGLTLDIDSRLPTFDKSLNFYFDQSFASIIEEWELLTDSDLHRLENRLQAVTREINVLHAGKMNLKKRVADLDDLISSMEKSV
jgi:hypothetical protein